MINLVYYVNKQNRKTIFTKSYIQQSHNVPVHQNLKLKKKKPPYSLNSFAFLALRTVKNPLV